MKTIALFFALTSALLGIAQPSFMKIFRSTGTAQGNLNELTSGNLRAGMARQSGTSLISDDGVIIQSHNYTVDTFLVLQAVKRHLDNDLYFVGGYHKDSCSVSGNLVLPYTYPVVGRMDSMGNVLSAKYYHLNADNCMNTAGDLEVMSNGSVLTWGTDPTRFFAMKADHDGNAVWGKTFDRSGAFRFIKELPGGDLLAGFDMDTAGAAVARLDANGNFIWCRSFMRPMGRMNDAVVEADDTFIVTGYTGDVPSRLFMMKLDGTGGIQWCRGYDAGPNAWYTLRPSRIVPTLDNHYVLLATLGGATFPYFDRPILMKTDENGDTLWTRTIGLDNYNYETNCLLGSSDGGFIYNGRIWGVLPEGQANFGFLFKSDSLGHLPCQERYHPIEVLDLFPSDSSFSLLATDGAVAFPAYIQDSLYPPITQYDGCTFTTGLTPKRYQPKRMTARPNPSAGHFTLEFNDPLQAESYYSVYDATGKLLYQRPLPAGKGTEEVDLSRYGKGTYVIKCTDKDGVYHQQVVVE